MFRVADALLSYLHELSAYAQVSTLNPVVAETNDGYLSDIWARPVTAAHVRSTLDGAAGGPVVEGCVGAGTGTSALGFKAGMGTSSRRAVLATGRPVTVGAIVQANFGGVLTVGGRPVPSPATGPAGRNQPAADPPQGGSCVIVLATDASLGSRELQRLASRAFAAMARTGSTFSGRSGDYAVALSTGALSTGAIGAANDGAANDGAAVAPEADVPPEDLDVLFTAAIEATEEAILNSLFMAETTTGYQGHVSEAVPLDLVSGRPGSPYGF